LTWRQPGVRISSGVATPTRVRRRLGVVPELAAAGLEARVIALVQSHRPQLAELVRQAVDRELVALVDAELARRNGNGAAPKLSAAKAQDDPPGEQRRCKTCGETKPLDRFEAHRHQCRECRRDAVRARERRDKAAATDDGPEQTSVNSPRISRLRSLLEQDQAEANRA